MLVGDFAFPKFFPVNIATRSLNLQNLPHYKSHIFSHTHHLVVFISCILLLI